jgi:hypothetical protein
MELDGVGEKVKPKLGIKPGIKLRERIVRSCLIQTPMLKKRNKDSLVRRIAFIT